MASSRTARSSRITWSALARLADEAGWEFSLIVLGSGEVARVNGAVVRASRRPDTSIVGHPFGGIVRKPDGKAFGTAFLRPRSRSNPQRRSFSILTRDGRLVPCRGVAFYFEGHYGDEGGVLLLGRKDRKAMTAGDPARMSQAGEAELFTALNDGLLVLGADATIHEANGPITAMTGHDGSEILGSKPPFAWLNPSDNRRFVDAVAETVRTGVPARLLLVVEPEEQSPISLSVRLARHPGAAHRIVVSLRDVSDVVPARESQMAGKRIERLSEQLQRNSFRLKTLQEINHALLRSGSLPTIFRRITDGVRRLVDHDLAGIYVFDGEEKSLRPHTLSRTTPFSRVLGKFPITPGVGIIGSAALIGETVLVNDAQHDPRSTYPPGMKPPIEHIIAAPLRGRESTYGILTVARNRHPGFNDEDALIVKSFADAASIAIDNIRLHSDLVLAGAAPQRKGRGLRAPIAPGIGERGARKNRTQPGTAAGRRTGDPDGASSVGQ